MPHRPPDPAAKIRELLLGALAEPESLAGLPAPDLDLLLRVARRARLLARIALKLDAAGGADRLPAKAQDQLTSSKAIAAARRQTAVWELDRLGRALPDPPFANVVVLKGGAYILADLPNRLGRVLADVDLLVPEAMLESAEQALTRAGWRVKPVSPYDDHYYRAWTHELPPMTHAERETEVDLHHNVLPRTARLKPDAALLLRGARPVEGTRYRVLAPESLLLHAMTHLMFDSDLADALRDLVDIDDLIRHFTATEPDFWPRFAARAEALDLRRPAFYALRYARRYFASPIPDNLLAKMEVWAPPGFILRLMDALVPRALFPPHPEHAERRTALARLLLYVRSHWIRMPPLLLLRHLSYKLYVTRLKRVPRPG
jgi:hypothetical protein